MKEHDDLDAMAFSARKMGSKAPVGTNGSKGQSSDSKAAGQEEGMGSQTENLTGMDLDDGGDGNSERERVTLSGSKDEEAENTDAEALGSQSSEVSFASQLENIKEGKPRLAKGP